MKIATLRLGWFSAVALAALLAVVLAACSGPTVEQSAASAQHATSAPPTAPTTSPTTTPSKVDCPTSVAPVPDIAYESIPGVAPRFTSLDIYPPPVGCPAPVVVWVHGGGWRAGDKRNQIADKIRLARDQGWVLVSVNYRLTNASSADPVRYPVHDEDVAAAVAWVHENVARYGGDPDRVALLGHSAGAQIVASIGTDERYLAEHGLTLSDVQCVGALDSEGFDVVPLASAGNTVYRAAFGDDPATWADASPIRHVAPGKGTPAFLVVERGGPLRRHVQQSFVDALRTAGVPVTVLDAGSLTHGQVNAEIGAPGDSVMTPPLVSFLSACFERSRG